MIAGKKIPVIAVLSVTLVFLALLCTGCTSNNSGAFSTNPESMTSGYQGGAQIGDTVEIEYAGTLDSGEVFESSAMSGQAYSFTLGGPDSAVSPAFEKALVGMKIGEIRNISLTPEEGHGDFNASKVLIFPLSALGGQNVSIGKIVFLINHEGGSNLTAKIIDVNNTNITVNYDEDPLVGQNLHYQVRVKNIVPGKGNTT